MTKDILIQYCDLTEEIKDLRKRILRIEEKINAIENDGVIVDSVTCGRKGKKSLGTVTIEGFPTTEYSMRKTALYTSKVKLKLEEQKYFELINEVEDFINSLNDSRMRRILRYRFLDGMKWKEVAANMGNRVSEDSIRKEFERFMSND